MEIVKCDICKRVKKDKLNRDDEWTMGHIWGKDSLRFDLCEKCSTKLIVYLKKYLKIKGDRKYVKKK